MFLRLFPTCMALAVSIAIMSPGALLAQSITIQNSGFELPASADGNSVGVNAPLLLGSNSNTFGNWTLSATTVLAAPLLVPARVEIINPTGAGPTNIAGTQIAVLRADGLAGAATSATVFQDLGVSYVGNTRYTLTANLGLETLTSALSDFGMQLTAGGVVVATKDKSTILSLLLLQNQLYQVTMQFTTTAVPPSGNVGVQFYDNALLSVGGAFLVDSVSLTAQAVPEPATVAMICVSVAGAAAAAWRYRRNKHKQLEATIS